MTTPLLQCVDLAVGYHAPVLEHVNVEIGRGEIVAMLGGSVLLAACGGKVPPTRFYQFADTKPAVAPHSALTLVIETPTTETAYDDERIVYRVTPYRLDYYNYHRWSAAPGTLVGNFLEQAFEKSGRFGSVVRDGATGPLTLRGRVVAIEEVDKSKTAWVGRIVLELALTDTATSEVLWSEQFEELEPVPVQTPEGLARALSAALGRIADRAIVKVADQADKHAHAHEVAKGSAGRSARLRP